MLFDVETSFLMCKLHYMGWKRLYMHISLYGVETSLYHAQTSLYDEN